ncbi:hypothetical protein [Isoptericola sp. NPDC057191]|uniref:hypothetical protein n=1 Tax=Isoptericola sp. NPDC057191 TaxID=3346041 RepID=UPI0036374188
MKTTPSARIPLAGLADRQARLLRLALGLELVVLATFVILAASKEGVAKTVLSVAAGLCVFAGALTSKKLASSKPSRHG